MNTDRIMESNESFDLDMSHFDNYRFKIEESQEDKELENYIE